MSDINFLDNKKHDDQKPKDKDDKKDELAWSSPKKEIEEPKKSSTFSFLSSLYKKEPADKSSASIIDKNRIKESREEILNLIKRHEDSKPLPKEKGKSFLRAIGEKLKKQPGHKEVLIDYQRVFNQEKEQKNQVGKIFNIKPTVESKLVPPLAGKSKHSRFKRLAELFKSKIIAFHVHKNETAKIIKLPKVEEIKPVVKPLAPAQPIIQEKEKSVEVKEIKKEIKIEEPEPIHKNEIRQRVLETNLIQGELVTFFDWRSKIVILASAILMPIFVVGAVYYGLAFYQKSNQAKNLAQAQKFVELEQNIIKEESGLKEIFDFEAQLKTVSRVFGQHLYWTNFFKFLEDNTIKDVYFIDFKGDTSGNYIMDALAANYSSISKQVNIFKNNKKITAAEAEGGEMVTGDDTNESLVKFILNF
ncbi:MAG: hypothetical protein V1801_02200, partial [Candidatus Falkowbacteria bacterium]